MELTKKKAKELSIKKWEYIVSNEGSSKGLTDKYPELENLDAECGYCEKYNNVCNGCPLRLNNKFPCGNPLHPWKKWSSNPTKANAQKVLNLIRKS